MTKKLIVMATHEITVREGKQSYVAHMELKTCKHITGSVATCWVTMIDEIMHVNIK